MFQPVLKWSSDRVACFQLSREEALKRLNDQIWDDSALFSLSASVVTMGQPLIQQLWEKLKIAHSSINRSQGTTSMTKTVLQDKYKDVLKDKYKDVLKDKYKDKDKDNLRCPEWALRSSHLATNCGRNSKPLRCQGLNQQRSQI